MTVQVLVATQNRGKLAEYQDILAAQDVALLGLADVGLDALDVDETGTTFEANAELKARAYAQASGKLALADDSGLVVDALDGAPGIYTARYGGPGLSIAQRRAHLLHKLQGVPDAQRTARFVCVIALCDPKTDRVAMVRGECAGRILQTERDGGYGFGYDPLFLPAGYTQSMAELEPDVKHRISHRGRAAAKLPPILAQFVIEK